MLNLSQYVTVPAVGVSRSVSLGISLLSAMPADAPAPIVNAATRLRERTVSLQADWAKRLSIGREDAVHSRDLDADRSWRGLHTALQAATNFAGTPRADAAQTVLSQVFPDGRSFLTLPYKAQWTEAERRLQHIETESLGPLIDTAVGGPEYLEIVQNAHLAYGAELNITQAAEGSVDVDLQEGVEAVRDSIREYMLQVVAWGNQAPANLSIAQSALLPIETAREDSRSSKSTTANAATITPQTPVPAVS